MLSGMPSGSMNYSIIHAMYYGLIVPSMCWRCLALDAYKEGILCESVLRREVRVCENVKRREEEGKRSCCHGQQPCCHMQQSV
jgi:hypothetical protein